MLDEKSKKKQVKTSKSKNENTQDMPGIAARSTGLPGINPPETGCNDKNCPFHGSLKIRGRTFTGKVVSAKAKKTATVEWTRWRLIRKYERFEKRKTKLSAHNPPCIDAKEGNEVIISECRPLSKTKNFVIVSTK